MALILYNSVFVPLCSPNTCKGVFNSNVTTFQSNCAEGLHFSAFHFDSGAPPTLFCVGFNQVQGYTIARARNSNWYPPILKHLPTPLIYIYIYIHVLYMCRVGCVSVEIMVYIYPVCSRLCSRCYCYIYICMFQAIRRAVNVLNVSRVSKYPPNAIFHNANINVQRANVTGSMNWDNNVEPPNSRSLAQRCSIF